MRSCGAGSTGDHFTGRAAKAPLSIRIDLRVDCTSP